MFNVGAKVEKVEVEAWAYPRPGLSLDDLVARLREVENSIVEVDRVNNRVKIMQVTHGKSSH